MKTLKYIVLKNNSGALLTVNIGQGRGLHILAGESKSIPASALEAPDVSRLVKRGYLAVVEEQPLAAPEKKKGKS